MIIRKQWNHNKTAILGLIILFLFGFALSANAATVTWTGGGADNLASNPANWSGNTTPQYGDDVIFDNTSKDCTWDLNVSLASLSIKSGYTGKVTKTSGINLTIAKNFVPPTAPSGLTATAISLSQINLSWTDNSNNETGFKIERKTGIDGTYGQIATVSENVTTYSDIGLTAGTTYYYKVRVYNSFADSGYSNEANTTTIAVAPTVTTNAVTNIGDTIATLNAIVNPNGSNTTVYFEWWTDINNKNNTISQSIGNGTNNINVFANLTGLLPNTIYYYRVVAINAGGTTNSNDMSFITAAMPTGTIQVNATLDGANWSGSVNYSLTGPENINGNSVPTTFSGKLTGTYTLAYNSGGPSGAMLNSITPSAAQILQTDGTVTFTLAFTQLYPPTTTTDPATNINGNSATLNAIVNPNGSNTTVYFEWWTDINNKNNTISQSIGNGTNNINVFANLTGLLPNTIYYYRVVAINAGGTTNGFDVSFTTPPITLTIISPVDGSVIYRPDVMIKGTVSNTTGNETGVTANGIVATVYGNEFVVNHLPLTEGSNTLTATATDTAGNTAATSIAVNAITSAPHIVLRANIESGLIPLITYFSISTSIPNAVSTYQMDFQGNGTVDYTGTTFDNISFTYTTEGIYYPTVVVTDNQGIQYSDTIAIVVLNTSQLDALLRAKWEAMKTALANQDVNTAVNYYTEDSKPLHNDIFIALYTQLPQIVQDMQDIQLIYAKSNAAKYRIRKNEVYAGQSIEITYYIYFVVGDNGIWRIDKF